MRRRGRGQDCAADCLGSSGVQPRDDMLPLCADCVDSPGVIHGVVRGYYPDLSIAGGGNVSTH